MFWKCVKGKISLHVCKCLTILKEQSFLYALQKIQKLNIPEEHVSGRNLRLFLNTTRAQQILGTGTVN